MKRNPAIAFGFRMVVAAYLVYISYVQFNNLSLAENNNRTVSLVFGILFGVVGVGFGIWAVIIFRKDRKEANKPEETIEETQETDEVPEETSESSTETDEQAK